jgi:hypothetical protein
MTSWFLSKFVGIRIQHTWYYGVSQQWYIHVTLILVQESYFQLLRPRSIMEK